MVVREHHRGGVAARARLDDLARIDAGLRQRAAEQFLASRSAGSARRGTAPRTPRAGARRACSCRYSLTLRASRTPRSPSVAAPARGARARARPRSRRAWPCRQALDAPQVVGAARAAGRRRPPKRLEHAARPSAARRGPRARCAAAARAARCRRARPAPRASSFSRGRASAGRSFSAMASSRAPGNAHGSEIAMPVLDRRHSARAA